MLKKIEYITSVGFRCYAPDLLKEYGLRKCSGPFDYIYIDLETCLESIHTKFDKFLKDIVCIHKNDNHISKHYYENEQIDYRLETLMKKPYIGYMPHVYNQNKLLINQNFLNKVTDNFYQWDRILVFHHQNILDQLVYQTIQKRCNRLIKMYESYDKLALLHITRIIEDEDITSFKKNIQNMMSKYDIQCYLIMIICSDKLIETHHMEGNILYIIKKVPTYKKQLDIYPGTDNNMNFEREYKIMCKYFDFDLVDLQHFQDSFDTSM